MHPANPYAPPPGAPNPYAAPTAPSAPAMSYGPGQPGIYAWRFGEHLAVSKLYPFPPVCLVTGEPATTTSRFPFQWQPRWTWWLLAIGPLPFLIVNSIYGKRATLMLPLSARIARRRLLGRISAALSLLLLLSGIFIAPNLDDSALGAVLALALFAVGLVGAVVSLIAVQTHKVRYVDDHFVVFRNVHPSVLAQYQEGPAHLPPS